jgi:formamidopyrimidine-DNA glycosylase
MAGTTASTSDGESCSAPVPELPETETIARDLDAAIRGAVIDGVTVARADVLREITPDELKRRVSGATIAGVQRRAKLVVLELDTAERIVVQPRFTGALLLDTGALPEHERRYSTMAFHLLDGRVLHYRDIRRLGTVTLMPPARWDDYSANLGLEPLDQGFTAEWLAAAARKSRQAIKKLLMDQRMLVGVGNIYANEALWRAGIDPSREARSVTARDATALHDAIVDVLRESIAARGTSFRDYRDASGERGGFVESLAVYGRGGLPCPRCGARLVQTHAIDGRQTVLCVRCQT